MKKWNALLWIKNFAVNAATAALKIASINRPNGCTDQVSRSQNRKQNTKVDSHAENVVFFCTLHPSFFFSKNYVDFVAYPFRQFLQAVPGPGGNAEHIHIGVDALSLIHI